MSRRPASKKNSWLTGRWTVACVNWGSTDAPKAVAYLNIGEEAKLTQYFPDHASALAHADRMARLFAVVEGRTA
ncbi:hypothetical protein [Zhihengliuella halotolerans]|uniref:hypothetical protein n=1 Tax=Zhihengliuella halotolerans TaxID=370736 RepID=UPI000C80433A|nr:hypothetical protein [Zhihengliuella halotolerans]